MSTDAAAVREVSASYLAEVSDAQRVLPGYKQTEVGVIPEDWEVDCLGDKTKKVGSGITPTGGERVYKKEGRPFLRSQNVGWGYLIMEDIAFIDDGTHETFKSTEIEAEDVFLNITGASIGRSAVADARVARGNVNQHVCIIRTDREQIHPRYLNYFLLSRAGQRQIDSFQAGGNRQGLNFGQIRSFQLPIPPLSEQHAIAAALSDVDALIAALDKLIAKKRAIKTAAMQQLLTGKQRLPGFEREKGYKQTEAGVVPEDWNVLSLQDICHFYNGRAYKLTEWERSGTPVIRLQNLTGGDGYYYSTLRLPPHQYCDYGDLLYMWSATFGPHIWRGGKAIYHYHIWKVEPRDGIGDKSFLYYKLDEITQDKKTRASNGGTMLHVTKGSMEKTLISLPSFEEQTAIATILSDMDAEIAALEARRDKTRVLKQGMMQELLTGKTRLV